MVRAAGLVQPRVRLCAHTLDTYAHPNEASRFLSAADHEGLVHLATRHAHADGDTYTLPNMPCWGLCILGYWLCFSVGSFAIGDVEPMR
jgi:hypothetical protein